MRKLKLTAHQQETHDQIVKITSMFFKEKKDFPFKINGFLIYGEPQSGKTETVRQVCLTLAIKFPGLQCTFLDSAKIAAPEFGASEKIIDGIFSSPSLSGTKRVIFFDDIDCLFFGRENITSQTWHISMSSVMFHRLDDLNPKEILFIATSNKKQLLDSAMQSRLMQIELKLPTREELDEKTRQLLASCTKIDDTQKDNIYKKVMDGISAGKSGFRDIQFYIVKYLAEVS